jgi:hypothetical protein
LGFDNAGVDLGGVPVAPISLAVCGLLGVSLNADIAPRHVSCSNIAAAPQFG